MSTTLLLAPVGAGKTERALDELIRTAAAQPFARIWVLLPGRRQEDAFRQRLIERGHRVYFNVTFFNFYSLYKYLLDLAGQPQRELVGTARTRVLRELLSGLKRDGQLQVYEAIADTPGFVNVIASFIYELKQNVVQPEKYQDVAQDRGPKDRELALIYATYQEKLREKELVDRDGEGWLAREMVRKNEAVARDVDLLLVDGFDQFNPLQGQLLALLAARVRRTVVTLPTVTEREATVGRRFGDALTRLQESYWGEQQTITIDRLPHGQNRPAVFRHLLENSFRTGVTPRPSEDHVMLIEAPAPAAEVNAVMRRVKRLLLTSGCQPDDIVIAVRDWERYGSLFAGAGRTYNIPLALHYGEPLANTPPVITLLGLLGLAADDFPRRDLLDALRSPYIDVPGLDSIAVDNLDRLSRALMVTGGREAWLEAINQAEVVPSDLDDERSEPLLPKGAADPLHTALGRFFDHITPPDTASVAAYIRWIEDLMGVDAESDPDDGDLPPENLPYSLKIITCARLSDDHALTSRDLEALYQFKQTLRSLLAAQTLFAALEISVGDELDWLTFLTDLKAAVGIAAVERQPNRSGKVLVTTVTDARGLPHRHVFIPGLSEGIFPAPVPEDSLYLDSERQSLTSDGVRLETQAERAADEGLFYELIGLASETLTLSRPTVQNGAAWPESHLWRAVRILFTDSDEILRHNRVRLGQVVPASEAASSGEAVLAVADALNSPTPEPSAVGLYNWLLEHTPDRWHNVRWGRVVEARRMSRQPHDEYAGRLRDIRLRQYVASELGPHHLWSASQFNDYGVCGFRYFAKRLLKLEALEEPEDGMDAARFGTVNHAILEKTYARLAQQGVTISPENTETAVSILRYEAAPILSSAPRDYRFRASALWRQEQVVLLRRLEALVRLDFSGEGPVSKKFGDLPRQPYRVEAPFGTAQSDYAEIILDDAVGALRVAGYIDRMDWHGDHVVLIDYKSGSTGIPTTEMEAGRNFQMMLYLLVGAKLLEADPNPQRPVAIAGGLFWHLRSRTASGAIHLDEQGEASIQAALTHLSQHIQRGRAGDFSAEPNRSGGGACTHYCEYKEFCRVSIMNHRKRQG